MPRPRIALRLFAIAALFSGLTLATIPDADAGIFRRSRTSSSGKGYAVRGIGPITVRVSSAKYERLKTFYPTVIRRVR